MKKTDILHSLSEVLNNCPGVFAKVCFCVLVKRHKRLSALAVGYAVKRDQMLAGGKYTVTKDGSDRLVGNALHYPCFGHLVFCYKRIYFYHDVGHKVIGRADATVSACRKTREKHLVGAVVEYLVGIRIYQTVEKEEIR